MSLRLLLPLARARARTSVRLADRRREDFDVAVATILSRSGSSFLSTYLSDQVPTPYVSFLSHAYSARCFRLSSRPNHSAASARGRYTRYFSRWRTFARSQDDEYLKRRPRAGAVSVASMFVPSRFDHSVASPSYVALYHIPRSPCVMTSTVESP